MAIDVTIKSKGLFKKRYVIFLISKNMAGSIPYEKFIENVNKDELYDAEHFLITMDSFEMLGLIDEYGVERSW